MQCQPKRAFQYHYGCWDSPQPSSLGSRYKQQVFQRGYNSHWLSLSLSPSVWKNRLALAPLAVDFVGRKEVTEGGRIVYYNEELSCGHVHQEFLEWNLSSKRRRCRKCQ